MRDSEYSCEKKQSKNVSSNVTYFSMMIKNIATNLVSKNVFSKVDFSFKKSLKNVFSQKKHDLYVKKRFLSKFVFFYSKYPKSSNVTKIAALRAVSVKKTTNIFLLIQISL